MAGCTLCSLTRMFEALFYELSMPRRHDLAQSPTWFVINRVPYLCCIFVDRCHKLFGVLATTLHQMHNCITEIRRVVSSSQLSKESARAQRYNLCIDNMPEDGNPPLSPQQVRFLAHREMTRNLHMPLLASVSTFLSAALLLDLLSPSPPLRCPASFSDPILPSLPLLYSLSPSPSVGSPALRRPWLSPYSRPTSISTPFFIQPPSLQPPLPTPPVTSPPPSLTFPLSPTIHAISWLFTQPFLPTFFFPSQSRWFG